MVVKYKTITDVVDKAKGYSEELLISYNKELLLAIDQAEAEINKDNPRIKIKYNADVLSQVVVDAVEDLKRIHDFHPIKNANAIKEAAYFGYWFIKRKPIYFSGKISQVKGSNEERIDKNKMSIIFINEFATAIYILPKIFQLSKLDGLFQNNDDAAEKNAEDWKKYFDNLLYHLAYRVESPKSLEAILTSLVLHPHWETVNDFWEVKQDDENT